MTTHTNILFDRIGGAEVVDEIVELLYTRILADPELSPFFEATSLSKLKRMQKEFISAALGGPMTVSDIDLARIHQDRGITRNHVTRFVNHLIAVLESLRFISGPDAMEIIGRIATYSDQVIGSAGGVDG